MCIEVGNLRKNSKNDQNQMRNIFKIKMQRFMKIQEINIRIGEENKYSLHKIK